MLTGGLVGFYHMSDNSQTLAKNCFFFPFLLKLATTSTANAKRPIMLLWYLSAVACIIKDAELPIWSQQLLKLNNDVSTFSCSKCKSYKEKLQTFVDTETVEFEDVLASGYMCS